MGRNKRKKKTKRAPGIEIQCLTICNGIASLILNLLSNCFDIKRERERESNTGKRMKPSKQILSLLLLPFILFSRSARMGAETCPTESRTVLSRNAGCTPAARSCNYTKRTLAEAAKCQDCSGSNTWSLHQHHPDTLPRSYFTRSQLTRYNCRE